MSVEVGVPRALLERLRANFAADPKNRLAQTACSGNSPLEILRRSEHEAPAHVFTHKVENECKAVTDQKASGRCWLFASLNCMRVPFIKEHNLEDFEFSQSHLYFWDKIERFHYLLNVFVDIARRGEEADGRLLQHMLWNPSEDGGQWHMVVNLIEKHGVMPKKCFSEAWSADNTGQLKNITNNKMREYCMRLRAMVKKGANDGDIEKEKEGMMEELHHIVSICLGTPPQTFTWEYYDKDKKPKKIGPIEPLQFYIQYIKPLYNVDDKVVLTNDPRPENPYSQVYTVEYLGNMVRGKPVTYNNQDIAVLKKVAQESIKNNEPVWFGCDVNQFVSWRKYGVEDLNLYEYELAFGCNMQGLSKADRLLFRDSLMTHAMVLTAVSEEDDGTTTKWRIENSWGDSGGDKGYMVMTDDWFSEYVFEVVVDKKFVPQEVQEVMSQTPRMLPAWDPMGALAAPLGSCKSNL